MKLLFTGDINFRGLAEPTHETCADILAEVLPYFEKAYFRVVDLETSLADKEKHAPIKKSGPNLICGPNNIMFLETLGADVCTLANSHTGDFGEGAVNLKDYNSAGNYNLIMCESHLSQAKKILEFCFLDQIEEVKVWAEEITKLMKMPI